MSAMLCTVLHMKYRSVNCCKETWKNCIVAMEGDPCYASFARYTLQKCPPRLFVNPHEQFRFDTLFPKYLTGDSWHDLGGTDGRCRPNRVRSPGPPLREDFYAPAGRQHIRGEPRRSSKASLHGMSRVKLSHCQNDLYRSADELLKEPNIERGKGVKGKLFDPWLNRTCLGKSYLLPHYMYDFFFADLRFSKQLSNSSIQYVHCRRTY